MPKYTQNSPHTTHRPQGPILPQFVHDYLAHGAQKGDRNDTLFRVAAQYLHAGITEADIAPQLLARAAADGLGTAEAQKASLLLLIVRKRIHSVRSASVPLRCHTPSRVIPPDKEVHSWPKYHSTVFDPIAFSNAGRIPALSGELFSTW